MPRLIHNFFSSVSRWDPDAPHAPGDKPELRWQEAADELASMGFTSTLEYVEAAARAVLLETGLLPHINAGVMSEEWMRRLKV
jgi:FO synthase